MAWALAWKNPAPLRPGTPAFVLSWVLPAPLLWLDSRSPAEALSRLALGMVLAWVIFRRPLPTGGAAIRGRRASFLLILGLLLAGSLLAGLGAEPPVFVPVRVSIWPAWLALFLLWEKWRHTAVKKGPA